MDTTTAVLFTLYMVPDHLARHAPNILINGNRVMVVWTSRRGRGLSASAVDAASTSISTPLDYASRHLHRSVPRADDLRLAVPSDIAIVVSLLSLVHAPWLVCAPARELGELLRAVAAFAAGGLTALADLRTIAHASF